MGEKKLYQVFSIDICFTSYAIDYVYVGGESIEDIREHFKFMRKKLNCILIKQNFIYIPRNFI